MEGQFPEHAKLHNTYTGHAVVGIMVDRLGAPLDFMVLKFTEKSFADEAMHVMQHSDFSPVSIKGLDVPGRLEVTSKFDLKYAIRLFCLILEQS